MMSTVSFFCAACTVFYAAVSSAAGSAFYAKPSGDWAATAWFSDSALKTAAEGAPGAEDRAYLGGGTLTVKAGEDIALYSLRLDAIAVSQALTLNQSGGTVDLGSAYLPSAYSDTSDSPALYIGVQGGRNSSAIYNLTGGTLSAPNGYIYVGGGSWTNQLNVKGGSLQAKGITGSGNQEFVYNQSGGTVALGAGGLVVPATTNTGRTLTFSGGTLLFTDDAVLDATCSKLGAVPVSNTPVFAALSGKTMTVKGTFSGTGTLCIGSAAAYDGAACSGTVDLSAAALSVAGVKLAAGQAVLGANRGISLSAAEGAADYAATVQLTAAEETAGLANNLAVLDASFETSRLTVLGSDGAEAEGTLSCSSAGVLTWSKGGLDAVSFTVPESWGLSAAEIPTLAQAFTPSASFALEPQAAAKQTVGSRTAYVGTVASTASVQAFGGKAKATKAVPAGTVAGDIWLKTTGGQYTVLAGGSDASGWNKNDGAGKSLIQGNVLLAMEGGSADLVMGAFYKDGAAIAEVQGNVAVVVSGEAVLAGAATGAGLLAHGNGQRITGSSLLWIRNMQGVPTVTTSQIYGDNSIFCGGPLYNTNTISVSDVEGGSAVVVELPQEASGVFPRTLVGGAVSVSPAEKASHRAGDGVVLTVSKTSEVRISAPDTVTFSGDIVGGGMAGTDLNNVNGGHANVAGNTAVVLNGGVYTGTITAGGLGNHAAVSGSAALTLQAGGFSAATLAPGQAQAGSTLTVQCAAEVKALTAFNTIDLSAEGAALTVTESFTLPESGLITVCIPAGAAVGAEIPLVLPESANTEETAARLSVLAGNRRYAAHVAGGRGVTAGIRAVLNRPATEAWADTELTLPGVLSQEVSSAACMNGAETYDLALGDATLSAGQFAAASGKTGCSLFGGAPQSVQTEIRKPIRIQVTGGQFARIGGGSDCGNWDGGKAKTSLFTQDILVDMAGGQVDYLSGGSYNDGAAQTFEGNLAVVLSGDAVVSGTVLGGGSASHGSTCVYGTSESPVELSVTVRNVQNDNSSAVDYYGTSTGPLVGAIVGGSLFSAATNPKQTVYGDTAVAVELGNDAAGKTFSKQLIGGMWLPKVKNGKVPGSASVITVTQQASVSVSAPADTVFSADITGGHWADASFTVCPLKLGSSLVALNGGVYNGTITAGSLGGKNNGLGAAELSVGSQGAVFTGTVQGGAASAATLALSGPMTLQGGTLKLSSFSAVSGEGALAVPSGVVEVGTLRASEAFGLLHVSEAGAGTFRVTADPAQGFTVKLPLVGEALTRETFTVTTAEGGELTVTDVTSDETGATLTLASFEPPLTASDVAGSDLSWRTLPWKGGDGAEVSAALSDVWTGEREITLAGDAAVAMAQNETASPLTLGGTGTLTLASAGGQLTASTVAVNTDTVIQAGAAKLSGVTVASGKTLTVRDTAAVPLNTTGAVKGSGTLRMEQVSVTRNQRQVSGEAGLDVGTGAAVSLEVAGRDDSGNPMALPLAVSGTGILTLNVKDAVGWKPSSSEVRNVMLSARDQGVIRNPDNAVAGVESMRYAIQLEDEARLEVGRIFPDASSYSAGWAMCKGSRVIVPSGAPAIAALAGVEGAAIALRDTATGTGIVKGTDYANAEFAVAAGASLTVDVILRHYANGTNSDFDVLKTGDGELILTQANSTAGNPLLVKAGRLRLKMGACWDAVTLNGTLAAEGIGDAAITTLTLGAGAVIDASAGAVTAGSVVLASDAAAVPVTLSEGAAAGTVVIACAEPSAEVAAALQAEGFAIRAVAGTGYVLASASAPQPANPAAFDAAALAALSEAAQTLGLADGFTVAVRSQGTQSIVGAEPLAANLLACFSGFSPTAEMAENVLVLAYDFGISRAEPDTEGTAVTVTLTVAGGTFRSGTQVALVAADDESRVLVSRTVEEAEDGQSVLTLDLPLADTAAPFKAVVSTP